MMILIIIETILVSTLLYLYLNHKTRISKKYLYIDNVGVILLSVAFAYLIVNLLPEQLNPVIYLISPILVVLFTFSFTMIRFWRTPKRVSLAKETEIVSPADGNVIYIKKIEAGTVPISIKNKRVSKLNELTKTDLLETPCWLIGINMTPFDVHKNCAPVAGNVILQKHFLGQFLSLKETKALTDNERNTFVIKNNRLTVGIVQIASRLVRKIDVYKKEGEVVKRGDWIGMIRFGSQVDVILPSSCNVKIKEKDQLYAGKTIIADF